MLDEYPPRYPLWLVPTWHVLAVLLAGGTVIYFVVSIRQLWRKRGIIIWPIIVLAAYVVVCCFWDWYPLNHQFLGLSQWFVWIVAGAGLLRSLPTNEPSRGTSFTLTLSGAAIGAVLFLPAISLIVPLEQGQGSSRRTQCRHQLRMVFLAMKAWHDRKGKLPDTNMAEPDNPPLSWRVALLPNLDQPMLRRSYDDERSWDDPANLEVAKQWFMGFLCPAETEKRNEHGHWFTSYFLITGPKTAFPNGKGISFDAITDGRSQTILVSEAGGQNIVWTEPRDLNVARDPFSVSHLTRTSPTHPPGILSSFHTGGGAQAVFADGSVKFISEQIDPAVLKALTTATGDETIPDR